VTRVIDWTDVRSLLDSTLLWIETRLLVRSLVDHYLVLKIEDTIYGVIVETADLVGSKLHVYV
jgi:hypothetical protein